MPHESERFAKREVAFAASSQKDSLRHHQQTITPPSFMGWNVHLLTELVGIETASGTDAGIVTAEIARAHVISEFEKFHIAHDRLFERNFDKVIN